jgi:hypothetical protein
MLLLLSILALGPGCSTGDGKDEDPSKTDSNASNETGSDTGAGQVPTGCVLGLMRTYSNVGLVDGPVRAFTHPPCVLHAETQTHADGTWCLEGIPVGEEVEIQVEFEERCSWSHARPLDPVPPGTCDKPETCRDMETWFECTPVGGSASCQ